MNRMPEDENSEINFILTLNALTMAMTKGMTPEQENVLGNLITMVGASILAKAAIDDAIRDSGEKDNSPSALPKTSKTSGSLNSGPPQHEPEP
jgi:hypothetical protein